MLFDLRPSKKLFYRKRRKGREKSSIEKLIKKISTRISSRNPCACFFRSYTLAYPRTPTNVRTKNIPTFFEVSQRVEKVSTRWDFSASCFFLFFDLREDHFEQLFCCWISFAIKPFRFGCLCRGSGGCLSYKSLLF